MTGRGWVGAEFDGLGGGEAKLLGSKVSEGDGALSEIYGLAVEAID